MEQKEQGQWAIVELFGHNQIAGLMSECSIGGCSFLRIDVPSSDKCPAYTKLFGNGAIYAITITDEETSRAAAAHMAPKPMTEWSAREMLTALGPSAKKEETVIDLDFICSNPDCEWKGLQSDCVTSTVDGSINCPECGEMANPAW